MTLPAFSAQSLYLDVGWGVVLAALLLGLLAGPGSAGRTRGPRWLGPAAVAAVAVGVALPGPWSPSFWLGMAFQYPSVVLVVLAGVSLARRFGMVATSPDRPLLAVLPAVTLLVAGAVLYAGAFALLPLDLYGIGFSGRAMVIAGTALVAAWAWLDRRSGWACIAVALAVAVHAATRLPSGNGWDALLDPFLVGWSAVVAVRSVLQRLRSSHGAGFPQRSDESA
jgi:hypothetical protein